MINNNLFDPYQGFIRGNMFKNIFDQFGKIYDVKPLNEQAELLTYIDAYTFACIDLKLYLDIFDDDTDLINLYNMYSMELKKYMMEYESKFGPLNENSNYLEGNWNWLSLFPKEV
jgi:spore coat protein JB